MATLPDPVPADPRPAHSALPWKHMPEEYDDWGTIRGADGLPVANACPLARYTDEEAAHARATNTCPPTVDANARLIVTAVNAHADLLAALKEAEDYLAYTLEPCDDDCICVLHSVRAAIAKVPGEATS